MTELSYLAVLAVQRLAPWALESTLLALGAIVLLRVLPIRSPHLRHTILAVALLDFLVPPLWSLPIGSSLAASLPLGPILSGPVATGATSGATPSPWPLVLLATHFVGALTTLGLGWYRLHHLEALRHRATPVREGPLHDELRSLAGRLRVGSLPELRITEEIAVPCVMGITSPAILLPRSFAERLGHRALSHVLAHELGHVHQRDSGWNLVRFLVCSVWWFHPLVWWIARQQRDEREMCCDVKLLAALDLSALDYARSLVESAEIAGGIRAPRLALGLFDDRHATLSDRLRQMARTPRDRWAGVARWALVLSVLVLSPLSLLSPAPALSWATVLQGGRAHGAPLDDPLEGTRVSFRHGHHHDPASHGASFPRNSHAHRGHSDRGHSH